MLELLALAAVIGAAWFAYGFLRGYGGGGSFTARTEGHIRGAGRFACDVVGESHYQDNLLRIAGGRTEDSAELKKTATLILDDGNPHDSNAVKVFIDGLAVGHLPRQLARTWRGSLRKQGLPVGNYTCDAMVVGGWSRGRGNTGHFGVRLDVPVEDD